MNGRTKEITPYNDSQGPSRSEREPEDPDLNPAGR